MNPDRREEQHSFSGTSRAYVDRDGELIEKDVRVLPFVAWTMLALLGLFMIVRFVDESWPWHLLGIVVAVFGTVASHSYRLYSHWFGVFVVVASAGSVLLHFTSRS